MYKYIAFWAYIQQSPTCTNWQCLARISLTSIPCSVFLMLTLLWLTFVCLVPNGDYVNFMFLMQKDTHLFMHNLN